MAYAEHLVERRELQHQRDVSGLGTEAEHKNNDSSEEKPLFYCPKGGGLDWRPSIFSITRNGQLNGEQYAALRYSWVRSDYDAKV